MVSTRSQEDHHHAPDTPPVIYAEPPQFLQQFNVLRNDMQTKENLLTQQILATREQSATQIDDLRQEMRQLVESLQHSIEVSIARHQKQPQEQASGQSSAGILGANPTANPGIQNEKLLIE